MKLHAMPHRSHWIDARPASRLEAALVERARRALATLPTQELEVLRWRFGISGANELSTAEIARRFALSPVRVRQIEANALRTLRHAGRDRRLRIEG